MTEPNGTDPVITKLNEVLARVQGLSDLVEELNTRLAELEVVAEAGYVEFRSN